MLIDLRQATEPHVSQTVDTLILDCPEWMGPNPRPYTEVLQACVIVRRDAARSSRYPPPARSTCESTTK